MIMETNILLRNFAIVTRLQDLEDTSILTHFYILLIVHHVMILGK